MVKCGKKYRKLPNFWKHFVLWGYLTRISLKSVALLLRSSSHKAYLRQKLYCYLPFSLPSLPKKLIVLHRGAPRGMGPCPLHDGIGGGKLSYESPMWVWKSEDLPCKFEKQYLNLIKTWTKFHAKLLREVKLTSCWVTLTTNIVYILNEIMNIFKISFQSGPNPM